MTIPGSMLGRFSGGTVDSWGGTVSRFSGAEGDGKTSAARLVLHPPSRLPPITIEKIIRHMMLFQPEGTLYVIGLLISCSHSTGPPHSDGSFFIALM